MALIKANRLPSFAQDRTQGNQEAELLSQLAAGDVPARRWAARQLADFPRACAALVARLTQEHDMTVRTVLLSSLTRIGNDEAVRGLTACLRSEDANLRNEAIEALKALPAETAPVMAYLLTDADSDVRILAINILESLRHADVERWLIEVIEHDAVVNVCGTAVDLLGEVGTELCVPSLHHLKARFAGEPYIAFAADLALGRIARTSHG
jgi:HEAT repeat protein